MHLQKKNDILAASNLIFIFDHIIWMKEIK